MGSDLFFSPPATARGKLALLVDVGYALLRETDRCPKISAVRESTIGAIFFAMEQSVQHEIDNEFELPDGMFWRQRILQAVRLIDSDLETPDADGCNWEEWEFLIDVLRDVIPWDRDFDSESTFVDAGLILKRRSFTALACDLTFQGISAPWNPIRQQKPS